MNKTKKAIQKAGGVALLLLLLFGVSLAALRLGSAALSPTAFWSGLLGKEGFQTETLILYHWNRHYPADTHFEVPMDGFKFESAEDIIGTSHETITKEVYAK